MSKNKSMDEVIRNLDNTSTEEHKKMDAIYAKLDDIVGKAKDMGLDILVIARDTQNEQIASAMMRNSNIEGEDDFSVAYGLLQSLVKGMIDANHEFLFSVIYAVKDVPGVDFEFRNQPKDNDNE